MSGWDKKASSLNKDYKEEVLGSIDVYYVVRDVIMSTFPTVRTCSFVY